jgi:nucleotide-binding universal stress UspA family protein
MDKRIVVGVDGSPASRMALRWAVEEAKLRGCEVEAVLAWHVDYGMIIGSVPTAVITGMNRDKVAEEYGALLADVVADADVHATLVVGDPREVLVKSAEDAALLVVGSRGAGPFREMLLGSVSSHCVHHAACPVVVIRAPRTHAEPVEPKPVITPGPLL